MLDFIFKGYAELAIRKRNNKKIQNEKYMSPPGIEQDTLCFAVGHRDSCLAALKVLSESCHEQHVKIHSHFIMVLYS